MNIIKRDEIEGETARARMRRLYAMGDVIGQGAFSIVRQATYKPTGETVAVKVIDRKSEQITEVEDALIEKEVEIVSSLDHPHIIRLSEFLTSTNFYYIVLEFCPGGELFDQIAKRNAYNEVDARDVLQVLCETIGYCHSKGIVHRDLKPENLLLSSQNELDSNIKISDFGLSATASGHTLTEFCGTPDYMAPELINSQPYGTPVDMWAIGVIAYCLIGGYTPFQEESEKVLYEKISSASFEFHEDEWGRVSEQAKDFIRRLLTIDPTQRMTAEQALQHAWFASDFRVELSHHDLLCSLSKLRALSAKKKFKAAGKAIIAANRMARLLGAFDGLNEDNTVAVVGDIELEGTSSSDKQEGNDDAATAGDAATSTASNSAAAVTEAAERRASSDDSRELQDSVPQDEVRGDDSSVTPQATEKGEDDLSARNAGCGCVMS